MSAFIWARSAPFVVSALSIGYAVHIDSLHRTDRRALDAMSVTVEKLGERASHADAMAALAQSNQQRAEGLQADLAGTRAFAQQQDERRAAVSKELLACRRELRETQARFRDAAMANVLSGGVK